MGYSAKEFFSAEREKTNADQVRHMSNEELKAWYCEEKLSTFIVLYHCKRKDGRFIPFVFPCLKWHEIPELPEGVNLKYE